MRSTMTALACLTSALALQFGCSSANTAARDEFNFVKVFGSLSDVDHICHFETFDGREADLSIVELERECNCEVDASQNVKYRNTMIVIKRGTIAQSEARHSDLGYQGDLNSWRREQSFCFSGNRLSLDRHGNLIISGAK